MVGFVSTRESPSPRCVFIGCHNQSELGLRARDQSCLSDHSCLCILYSETWTLVGQQVVMRGIPHTTKLKAHNKRKRLMMEYTRARLKTTLRLSKLVDIYIYIHT